MPASSPSNVTTWQYKLGTVPLSDDLDIIGRISDGDGMFKEGLEEHYRMVGRSALEAVRLAILVTGKETFHNVLDLPCGHGRVMRALRAAFPKAKLTACDLDRKGVDFCSEHFAAEPNYSNPLPSQVQLDGNYDLIWSGSLLTHLNADACREFLKLFRKLLAPGGIMMVTTHGRLVINRFRARTHNYGLDENSIAFLLENYDRDGFGYSDYPKRTGYGISVCSPKWLMSEIAKLTDLSIAMFSEHCWAQHQDVIACVSL